MLEPRRLAHSSVSDQTNCPTPAGAMFPFVIQMGEVVAERELKLRQVKTSLLIETCYVGMLITANPFE